MFADLGHFNRRGIQVISYLKSGLKALLLEVNLSLSPAKRQSLFLAAFLLTGCVSCTDPCLLRRSCIPYQEPS